MATRPKTDEGIAKDVVDSLYWDSRVDASKVSVRVDDGIVTLSGAVPLHSIMQAVLEDTWIITGVRDVQNLLKIDVDQESPPNSEIRSNIERSFTWDAELNRFDIDADVLDGWVTLEGTVDAFWKKARAEEIVVRMKGVVGVTNKIAVVPTQTYQDEKLAKDVTDALDRNIIVDVDNINVTVEAGVVILTGTVSSWAAKRAAYDAARYTRGVKEVNNQLLVVS